MIINFTRVNSALTLGGDEATLASRAVSNFIIVMPSVTHPNNR